MKNNPAKQYRTWIEIDQKALRNNIKTFRALLHPTTKLGVVVKSNAYGHDIGMCAVFLAKEKVDWLFVDSCTEALFVRKKGVKVPLLVLGYTLPRWFLEATTQDIRLTVSSFSHLVAIEKMSLPVPVKVHLKIDTGMHRQGFQLHEIGKLIQSLKKIQTNIIVEGVYTHFSSAKNPSFPQETQKQINAFHQAKEQLYKQGFCGISHMVATAGLLAYPKSQDNLVRIGIGVYGLWPAPEIRAFREPDIQLTPVLTWRAIISEVKKIKTDGSVGYDLTETVNRNTTLAIVPVGYWHGYDRKLSSIGHVLVHGKRARVVGRVSMDMLVIDITGIAHVKTGDTVTLIGADGKEYIGVEELAILAGTTAYEFITRLNARIKRISE